MHWIYLYPKLPHLFQPTIVSHPARIHPPVSFLTCPLCACPAFTIHTHLLSTSPCCWCGDPHCLILGTPCPCPHRVFHAGVGSLLSKVLSPRQRWADFVHVDSHMRLALLNALVGFSMLALACFCCVVVQCHTFVVSCALLSSNLLDSTCVGITSSSAMPVSGLPWPCCVHLNPTAFVLPSASHF